MKTVRLSAGQGDKLDVSTYVMGTGFFNTRVSIPESVRILDYYYEKGGKCLDTARYYGMFDTGESRSEKVLGMWLKDTKVRDQLVISTKGGHPHVDTTRMGNPDGYTKRFSRLTRDELYKDLNGSLEDLGIDMIDIYWLHRDEPDVPVEEIMPILDEFVKKKQVRFIGASNWTTDRIDTANKFAAENGMTPFSSSQLLWSLAVSTPESIFDDSITYLNAGSDDYNWYKRNGLMVFAFSSQAGGLFSRALADPKDPQKGIQGLREIRAPLLKVPENINRIKRVGELCKRTGLSPAEVCTSYLLSKDLAVVAMLGCRTLEQLKDSLGHVDYVFDDETVRWLESGND